MKNLRSYLNESIWDIEDNVENDNEEFVVGEIKKFLEDNYKNINIDRCEIVFDEKRSKYIANLNGKLGAILKIKAKQLTNELFEWGVIEGDFICSDCENLTSLKGAPEKVEGWFVCSNSPITSLKGAPKEVGGAFYCLGCEKLTSLEGAPKTVGGDFCCSKCDKLTTLKGAPKTVGEDFRCHKCPNLHSLDGIGKVKGKILSDIG